MNTDYLNNLRQEYEDLNAKLSSAIDPSELRKVSRRHLELSKILDKANQLERLNKELAENQTLVSSEADPEMQAMAQEEINRAEAEIPAVEDELKRLLIPKDPADNGDVIIEIRAGAGGDEAGLFAAELVRMYTRFSERQGFKVDMADVSRNELGGVKEAVMEVKGEGAYGLLKHEGGVHRVQRVPDTEKSGRVHTSTASVAVLPLVDEKEFNLDPKEVKIEATTSSGNGGQSVNTTYSAIRMVHLPTGITASCQDERSQTQNKAKAWRVLISRVAAHQAEERSRLLRDARSSQIKGADRSDKIRTYNFPQDRITDHRLNQNFSQIPVRMDGDIAEMVELLQQQEENEKLQSLEHTA